VDLVSRATAEEIGPKYKSGPPRWTLRLVQQQRRSARSINQGHRSGLCVSCNSRGDRPEVYLRATEVGFVSRATAEEIGPKYKSGPPKWTLCLAQQRRGGRGSYPRGGTTAAGLSLSRRDKKMTQFRSRQSKGGRSQRPCRLRRRMTLLFRQELAAKRRRASRRVSKLFVFFNSR
jgi:hypothetical protein